MSGGHFDYKQYQMQIIIDEIEKIVEQDEYSEQVITQFKKVVNNLKDSFNQIQAIDKYISGNIDEDEMFKICKK